MFTPDWLPPVLETERLVLRPFTEADAPALFQHARNPNVTRFTLWDHHKSLDDAVTFVRDYARCRYLEHTPEPYAITLRPDTQPVGAVGCFWASQSHKTMELGYWLAEPYWGKGITAEACRAVVDYSFRDHGPQRIQARVIVGNDASARVLAKIGFAYEGTLRASLLRRGIFEDVMFFAKVKAG